METSTLACRPLFHSLDGIWTDRQRCKNDARAIRCSWERYWKNKTGLFCSLLIIFCKTFEGMERVLLESNQVHFWLWNNSLTSGIEFMERRQQFIFWKINLSVRILPPFRTTVFALRKVKLGYPLYLTNTKGTTSYWSYFLFLFKIK